MQTFLAVLVVALAGTSAWLWQELAKERARDDAVQARAMLQDHISIVAATGSPTAAPAETGRRKEPAEDGSSFEPEYPEESQLLQDAGFREATRRFRILELTSGHLDLARKLGISQETADRLIELLVEREIRYSSQSHPNPRNEEEMRARKLEIAIAEQEADAEIAGLIGESRLATWKDYQGSLQIRHQVYRFGARLFASGEPLHEDRVEPLISAIYRERQRADRELTDYTASLVWSGGMEVKSHRYRDQRALELNAAADERIRGAAAGILSHGQLAVFVDMLRRSRKFEAARSEMFRARQQAAWITAEGD